MSTVTLKEMEQSAVEQLTEKPEFPGGITLDNKQVAELIGHSLLGYNDIVKPAEEVSAEGVEKMISVQHKVKYDETIDVPWGSELELSLDKSQLILYSRNVWSNITKQIDNYLRNHPVMLAEEPPKEGVVVIDNCKAYYAGLPLNPKFTVIVSFTIYFQL